MEIVSNCCGAKVEGLNADNIGRCSECSEGCGVDYQLRCPRCFVPIRDEEQLKTHLAITKHKCKPAYISSGRIKEVDKNLKSYCLKEGRGVEEEEQASYTCNKCGREFLANEGIDKRTVLCTPCWKDYVQVMHSDFVSVDEKVRISKLSEQKK